MNIDFPRVPLSDAQRLWLEGIRDHQIGDSEAEYRRLRRLLRDRLPDDFDPKLIDYRLLHQPNT